jgi:hypothetical protein
MAWVEQRKTGKLTFNFFKGAITNVNLEESKKLPESKRAELIEKKGGENDDKH